MSGGRAIRTRRRHRVGLIGLTAGAGAPAAGVTARVLASGTSDGTVEVRSEGRTDVVVREIVIPPGGSTGWHYHHGQLIAVVRSGVLTRTLADRTVETTAAGQAFVEPAGSRHIHNARNLGTEPVVLCATYVLPAGSPLSVDAPGPHRP